MNPDNGTPKKFYDVRTLGIEETDSCPVCKRQLKALVEEYKGGCIQGRQGEWICFGCGVLFIPKSRMKKMIEALKKEEGLIIKPSFIPPPRFRQ